MYNNLKDVLQYIVDKIKEHSLQSKYSQLSQYYSTAATAPTAENDELIKSTMQLILDAQEDVEPSEFDAVFNYTFQKLDKENVLGSDAISKVRDQLSQTSNNPHATATILQEMANKIETLSQSVSSSLITLGSLWVEEKPLENGYVEIQIVFSDKVAIKNFTDMNVQSKFWTTVNLLVNHAIGKGESEPEIVGMFKFNPSGVSLKTKIAYAVLILTAVEKSLAITKDLLGFTQSQNSFNNLPMTEERKAEFRQMLKDEEEKALKEEIEKRLDQAVEELKDKLPTGQELNSSKNDTRIMIKQMYNFTSNGGAVTIVDVAPDVSDKIKVEHYNLPEQAKEIGAAKKRLNNPVLPPALLSPEEETIMDNPDELKKQIEERAKKINETPIPTPASEPKQPEEEKPKRGRPPLQQEEKPTVEKTTKSEEK